MIVYALCTWHGQVYLSEPIKEDRLRQTTATYFLNRDFYEIDITVQIKEALNKPEKFYTVVAIIDKGKKYTRKSYAVQADRQGYSHMADVEIPSLGRSVVVYFSI